MVVGENSGVVDEVAVIVVCGCSGCVWLWWLYVTVVVVCGCDDCVRLW